MILVSCMANDLVELDDREFTKTDIVEALFSVEGNLSAAAKILGVRRNKLASFINNNRELRAIHMDFMEAMIDAAQDVVFTAVKDGDYDAAAFVLTTLGKDRGYSSKQEFLVKKEVHVKDMDLEELSSRKHELLETLAKKLGYVKASDVKQIELKAEKIK